MGWPEPPSTTPRCQICPIMLCLCKGRGRAFSHFSPSVLSSCIFTEAESSAAQAGLKVGMEMRMTLNIDLRPLSPTCWDCRCAEITPRLVSFYVVLGSKPKALGILGNFNGATPSVLSLCSFNFFLYPLASLPPILTLISLQLRIADFVSALFKFWVIPVSHLHSGWYTWHN